MPDLPSIDEPKQQAKSKSKPKPQPKKTEAAPLSEGYIPRNVDVRMNRQQATILRDKMRLLQDVGAKTADGKYVTNRAQVVRWILENEVVV